MPAGRLSIVLPVCLFQNRPVSYACFAVVFKFINLPESALLCNSAGADVVGKGGQQERLQAKLVSAKDHESLQGFCRDSFAPMWIAYPISHFPFARERRVVLTALRHEPDTAYRFKSLFVNYCLTFRIWKKILFDDFSAHINRCVAWPLCRLADPAV